MTVLALGIAGAAWAGPPSGGAERPETISVTSRFHRADGEFEGWSLRVYARGDAHWDVTHAPGSPHSCSGNGGRFSEKLTPQEHDRLASLVGKLIEETGPGERKAELDPHAPWVRVEAATRGKVRHALVLRVGSPTARELLELVRSRWTRAKPALTAFQAVELRVAGRSPDGRGLEVELANPGRAPTSVYLPRDAAEVFRAESGKGPPALLSYSSRPASPSVVLQGRGSVRVSLRSAEPLPPGARVHYSNMVVRHHAAAVVRKGKGTKSYLAPLAVSLCAGEGTR